MWRSFTASFFMYHRPFLNHHTDTPAVRLEPLTNTSVFTEGMASLLIKTHRSVLGALQRIQLVLGLADEISQLVDARTHQLEEEEEEEEVEGGGGREGGGAGRRCQDTNQKESSPLLVRTWFSVASCRLQY